jgi:hypothetical protein
MDIDEYDVSIEISFNEDATANFKFSNLPFDEVGHFFDYLSSDMGKHEISSKIAAAHGQTLEEFIGS